MKTKGKIYLWGVMLLFFGVFFGKTDKAFAATCEGSSGLGGSCVFYCDLASNFVSTVTVTDCNSSQECCIPSSNANSTAITCTSLGGDCSRYCLDSETEKTTATDCASSIPHCCAQNNAADACTFAHPGFSCINNTGKTDCVAGLCPGAANIQCCPASSDAGTTTATCGGANFEKIGGVCFPTNTGLPDAPVSSILENLLSWLLGLFTVFSVAAFVISGTQYLISTGNEDMIETAKRNATFSIIGILVGLSGFVIVKAIAAALSGSNTFF